MTGAAAGKKVLYGRTGAPLTGVDSSNTGEPNPNWGNVINKTNKCMGVSHNSGEGARAPGLHPKSTPMAPLRDKNYAQSYFPINISGLYLQHNV